MRNGKYTAFTNKLLKRFNRKIVQLNRKDIVKRKNWINHFLFNQPKEIIFKILMIEDESLAQYKQDIFALAAHNFKENGFFVEFGATNGIDLSNTFILEKKFNWKGILAEPAKGWHKQLRKNRACDIESDCVWSQTGEILRFSESSLGVISSISSYMSSDQKRKFRSRNYNVTTISLNDLLKKYNAPRQIDYLSIDTEGSEFEILKEFDFSKYDIRVITIEYNNHRNEIFNLLTNEKYVRKYSEVSECDDWYVKFDA